MAVYWQKLDHKAQDERITQALEQNIDYKQKVSLGIPASRLDPNVFYDQAPFLKDAPLLRTYVQNPNHIGCHTMGDSEAFFKGTQELEKEVIELLCVDVFKAEPAACDGYIASGGTEANIQAIWIYRNFFLKEHQATHDEIAILCSEDTHYSIPKASDLLHLRYYTIPVNSTSRTIDQQALDKTVQDAIRAGTKYFIIISNMGTTMFGSVDDPGDYIACMEKYKVVFKLHVDGAFGGFIYPFSKKDNQIGFHNAHISSITLDAHKMLQAPYGTGIFLARKGLMNYVYTLEARYVNGMDITLSGSRSGANAIAIWMILSTYGPYGWMEKIRKLLYRTDWVCEQLDELGIPYFRHRDMNIVAIHARSIPPVIATGYGLVPDSHSGQAKWFKIVVMDHVELSHLQDFISDLATYRTTAYTLLAKE